MLDRFLVEFQDSKIGVEIFPFNLILFDQIPIASYVIGLPGLILLL